MFRITTWAQIEALDGATLHRYRNYMYLLGLEQNQELADLWEAPPSPEFHARQFTPSIARWHMVIDESRKYFADYLGISVPTDTEWPPSSQSSVESDSNSP